MPSIRSGFGSDFVLKSEKIGIGSTTPTSVFDVAGAIKGDFAVTGVATLTSYGGFVAQNQHINKASSIGFATVGLQTGGPATGVGATHVLNQYYETETGFTDLGGVHHGDDQYFNTLSEDLIVEDGQILNITNTEMVGLTTIGEYDPHTHASYVCAGSLEQVSVTGHFSVPNGGTNDRQETPIEGTVRFNDDLNTLEFFNGNEWRQFTYNQGQSGRGFVMGGFTPVGPAVFTNIEFYNIMTTGNSQEFGNLTESRHNTDSCASETRAINTGTGSYNNTIDYITMASQSNGIDFGDLSTANRAYLGALASSTRGVFGGGFQHPSPSSSVDVIDYIEIATIGNALDFGNLSAAKNSLGAASSPTRGVFSGGSSPGIIEYITIASKGNATTDALPYDSGTTTGASNSVKALFETDKGIFSLNISSLGNQEYFGDLTTTREDASCASSPTRVCFAGGITPSPSPAVNIIDYVTIASTGNAIDFGDVSYSGGDGMTYGGGCSDSHGGLGGF